jgi:hypothetical protein
MTRLRQKEQGAAVCGRGESGNGIDSQWRQRRGQATVAKAEAAQGQTTINQKVAAKMFKILLYMLYFEHNAVVSEGTRGSSLRLQRPQ